MVQNTVLHLTFHHDSSGNGAHLNGLRSSLQLLSVRGDSVSMRITIRLIVRRSGFHRARALPKHTSSCLRLGPEFPEIRPSVKPFPSTSYSYFIPISFPPPIYTRYILYSSKSNPPTPNKSRYVIQIRFEGNNLIHSGVRCSGPNISYLKPHCTFPGFTREMKQRINGGPKGLRVPR